MSENKDELVKTMQDFNDGVARAGEAILSAFATPLEAIAETINAWVEKFIPMTEALRKSTDDINIALGRWQNVSKERLDQLDPDERWEYQK